MAFSKRRDGTFVRGLPPFKRLFPYVMATRTESIIYFNQKVDMTAPLAYLEELNRGKPREERITLFHLFLAATARTLALRPELNRFIAGRRIYEHNDIRITFIVKREMTEESPESEAQITFSGRESLGEVRDKVRRHLSRERSDEKGDDDKLIELVAALPRPLINLVAWLIRTLDYHNVLPGFLMKAIPLYTSVYITNVGSIGLDAPYHHLYEIGNASLFMAIGKLHREPFVGAGDEIVARDCINVTFTLDERITEGFYCAKSILLFQSLVENPRQLESAAAAAQGAAH